MKKLIGLSIAFVFIAASCSKESTILERVDRKLPDSCLQYEKMKAEHGEQTKAEDHFKTCTCVPCHFDRIN